MVEIWRGKKRKTILCKAHQENILKQDRRHQTNSIIKTELVIYKHTSFSLSFALLCFTDTVIFFSNKLKVCGNVMLSNSITTIFPTCLLAFVLLFHILVILAILKKIHYYNICFCDLWSMICAITIAKKLQVTEVSVNIF